MEVLTLFGRGAGTETVCKSVILIGVIPMPFLTSRLWECFFYGIPAFDYFCFHFHSIIHIHVPFFSVIKFERKRSGITWHYWLEGKLIRVPFKNCFFFFLSSLGWNGLKRDSTSTVNPLKSLNLKLRKKSFIFVREGGGGRSLISVWPSHTHCTVRWTKLEKVRRVFDWM